MFYVCLVIVFIFVGFFTFLLLCTVFVLEEFLFPKIYARYVDVITFHFSRVPTNLLYPNYSPDYLTPFKINRHITF